MSLNGFRFFEIMCYLQLQDSINNVVVNNSNLTSQHAIITHSSDSYTVSDTCSNTARTHWHVREYLSFLCTCSFPWQDSGIFYKKLISSVNEFHDAKSCSYLSSFKTKLFHSKISGIIRFIKTDYSDTITVN